MPQIEVTFDIDANGIVHVTAKDKGTGKENTIKIQEGSGLSKEEIDRMIKDAEAHADEDRKRREEADVRNQAETLVYQTEKFVKEQREAEGGSKVPEDTLNKVDAAVAEAKTALGGTDISAIKSAMEKLGQESQALGQAIYEATQAEQAAGGGEPGPAVRSADDVVDAEVVDDDREGQVSRRQSARAGNRHRQTADRSRDRRSTSRRSRAAPAGAAPEAAGLAPARSRRRLTTKVAELTADLQRVQADYANYRKRALRDQQAAAERAKAAVVSQLLGVLDDLERARSHGDLESGPLKSVADKLVGALTGLGSDGVRRRGRRVRPGAARSRAARGRRREGSKPVIGTVMRQGYKLGEQVLRHALVGVVDTVATTKLADRRHEPITTANEGEQRRRIRTVGEINTTDSTKAEEVTRYGPA